MRIKSKRKQSFIGVSILLTLFLYACSDQRLNDLHHYIDKLKKAVTKHKREDIIAKIELPRPVIFQVTGKQRDPFEEELASYNGNSTLTNPLISFPLKMFEFMGIIVRDNQKWVIIKAPDNKVYQMTIHDRIGNHYGKIMEIHPNRIDVEEEMSTQEARVVGRQGRVKRIVTIQLKGGV